MSAARDHRHRTAPSGPRLARRMLLWAIGEPGAEAILGDIEEGYAAGRSRIWYWSQTMGSIFSWWRRSLRAGGVRQDLHHALRKLRLRPGFSVVIVLTLALGIGANAAIFALVNAVVLEPLPYPEPERLAMVRVDLEWSENDFRLSPWEFQQLAARTDVFASVGGVRPNWAEILVSASIRDSTWDVPRISVPLGKRNESSLP